MREKRTETRPIVGGDFPFTASLKYNLSETPVILLDISLRGALIRKPDSWDAALHDSCVLCLHESDTQLIEIAATVAQITGDKLGLNCDYIDVESITQLKQLIEAYFGGQGMLNRELIELTAHHKECCI